MKKNIILLFFWIGVVVSKEYLCTHDSLPHPPPPKREKRGGIPATIDNSAPIRVHFDTSFLTEDLVGAGPNSYACFPSTTQYFKDGLQNCETQDRITPEKKGYIEQYLLPETKSWVEKALYVIPFNISLHSNGNTQCGSTRNIPNQYIAPGLSNTDLIVLVSARPDSDSILATASACVFDDFHNNNERPVFGWINFNPRQLPADPNSQAALNERISQRGTAIHELTHVLGFSSGLFTRFIGGTPITPAVITGAGGNTYNADIVTTPTVIDWVRNHFDCPSLTGGQIEEGGGPGTAGSHWEKRLFNSDYMIGTGSNNPALSGLTLALLQDSGWYWSNFSVAERLFWGYKRGCSFTEHTCMQNWPTTDGYLCPNSNGRSCSADRKERMLCQQAFITYDSPVPAHFRYFSDPNRGGFDPLADYCPRFQPVQGFSCLYSSDEPKDVVSYGSQNGETSRCFDSTLAEFSAVGNQQAQRCYPHICTGPTRLKIRISGYWYDCPIGGKIKAADHAGELTCPTEDSLCDETPLDLTWPEFISITPNRGGPGTRVTIIGTNFTEDMEIIISERAKNCEFISPSEYHCDIADSSKFRNPRNLISTEASVILEDPFTGKSCVGVDAFSLKISFSEWLEQIGKWLADNPGITALLVILNALFIAGCIIYCYRERKRAKGDYELP